MEWEDPEKGAVPGYGQEEGDPRKARPGPVTERQRRPNFEMSYLFVFFKKKLQDVVIGAVQKVVGPGKETSGSRQEGADKAKNGRN